MKHVIAVVIGFLLVLLNVSAQKIYSDAPFVSLETALKGRQAVTDFLLREINGVSISYSGRSIVNRNDYYFDLNMLNGMGYIHRGQFTELSDALYTVTFRNQVVETPDNQYEVYVNISASTSDRKVAFNGNGYLDIRRDSEGTLTAGTFEPGLSLNYQIEIRMDKARQAKWLGNNWQEQYLEVVYNEDGTRGIILPIRLLERGFLVVAQEFGEVIGWNLSNGALLHSKQIRAFLGQLHSSDVRTVLDSSSVDTGNEQFYRSEGKVYGRFPLLDVVTGGRKELVNPQIPVWGSTNKVSPSRMFVTPIYVTNPGSPLLIGTEYELQRSEVGLGFILIVPAGGYHIRSEFDNVLDWEADPNPGKG